MNPLFPIKTTIKSKGKLLDLTTPVVMGILNATPDSFYNMGRDSDIESLLRNAEQMINDGAQILDIGGASSKSGQELISPDIELKRITPVVEKIVRHFPEIWISLDTYNSRVAAEAVAAGAHIVNDVSAGNVDIQMIPVVASLGVPFVAMHMQGTPKTMQQNPKYEQIVIEIRDYLRHICAKCKKEGIEDVIIDPGFGFGKTIVHNFEILKNLSAFRTLGYPILAGLSRKSMVCKPLNIRPDAALNGTTALNMVALLQGANILRVHDVKEAVEVVKLFGYL